MTMGLLLRRRRPLMRLAAGAATAGVAYDVGRRRAAQDACNREAREAYAATTATPPRPMPVAAPAPSAAAGSGAGEDGVAQLERLAALHQSGALSDAEFASAKAKWLSP
jgi:hypothetical protein